MDILLTVLTGLLGLCVGAIIGMMVEGEINHNYYLSMNNNFKTYFNNVIKDIISAINDINKVYDDALNDINKVHDDAFANNSTDNESISDCLIIGFDKHKGEQTWMSIGRKEGDILNIVNMIKDERAEELYKQLLSPQKSVSQ